MRYPKLRELKEAIKSLFSKPYTTKYPFEPHIPHKKFRGKPEYSKDGCICCMGCKEVCPSGAIEVEERTVDGKTARKMVLHLDVCIFCGQCQALCTTRDDDPPGIKLTNEFDLAGFVRAELISPSEERELALCEVCGEPLTTKAHLEWIAKKLGPLAYSNPTLFLSTLQSMGLSDSVFQAAKDLKRSDRMKILCAKHRREATLEQG
ncbi:MAG: 4Fe-4S dicluster domain-containing protein [Candidatus Omnitrophota bacterium]